MLRSLPTGAALVWMMAATLVAHHQQSLERSQPTHEAGRTIRGRVLADESGDPLRNAVVALDNSACPPVMTDGDGRFTLVDVPPGVASLTSLKTAMRRRRSR